MHTANSIPLMKVASSKIAAIGHDAATTTLAIQFLSKGQPGNVYHYSQFSAADYDAFSGAESIGKHFIAHIQPAKEKYPYQNMGVPSPVPVVDASALTKELLAVALNGRTRGNEMTKEEELQAKAAGLVVVFGASDDLMELRGAITDEFSCYDGGTALIDAEGLLPDRDGIDGGALLKDFFSREPLAKKVEALWCAGDDATWTYKTDVTHATFDIMEDGEVYCRGMVLDVKFLS